jgi:hypothetical protein
VLVLPSLTEPSIDLLQPLEIDALLHRPLGEAFLGLFVMLGLDNLGFGQKAR